MNNLLKHSIAAVAFFISFSCNSMNAARVPTFFIDKIFELENQRIEGSVFDQKRKLAGNYLVSHHSKNENEYYLFFSGIKPIMWKDEKSTLKIDLTVEVLDLFDVIGMDTDDLKKLCGLYSANRLLKKFKDAKHVNSLKSMSIDILKDAITDLNILYGDQHPLISSLNNIINIDKLSINITKYNKPSAKVIIY